MKKFFISLVVLFNCVAAQANDKPKLIATHKTWSVYSFMEKGKKVCYMASTPKKSEGKYHQRGTVHFLITNRTYHKSQDVVSHVAGYTFGKDAEVQAIVKSDNPKTKKIIEHKFTLLTKDDTAWAPDDKTDSQIVKAMKQGTTLEIKGASSRGTQTIDIYSLTGFTAAYNDLQKQCPLK